MVLVDILEYLPTVDDRKPFVKQIGNCSNINDDDIKSTANTVVIETKAALFGRKLIVSNV